MSGVPDRLSLDGRVAIVTGGGTGLGRAMSLALAEAGADLVLAGRRPGPLEETARAVSQLGRRALAAPTDVTDSSQVQTLVAHALKAFGRVDVLVNNAGSIPRRAVPLWEVSDEEWAGELAVNLTGAFYCCRAVARPMVEQGYGRIINISSGLGVRGARDLYAYCSAKGGVVQLTRALAMSLGRHGVTCNCILPGYIPTEGTTGIEDRLPRPEFVPTGRLGRPGDLRAVVVFLASEASSHVNGALFPVDGGALAGGFAPTGFTLPGGSP